MTMTVGLRELTHNVGTLVRATGAGERIVATDRGRPIADIVPHSDAAERARQERIETDRINAMLALVGDDPDSRDFSHLSDPVLEAVEWTGDGK